MSKKAKTILAVVLLLAVAAAILAVFFLWGPPAQKRAAEAQLAEASQAAEKDEKSEAQPEATEAQPEDQAEKGVISITFVVVHKDGSQKEFVIQTDAVTLRAALEKENLIEGTESEWGLYVLTVDGETVNEAAQEWWCLTKDGEMTPTGVDDTVIADGEHYEFTFTVGW